MSLSISLGSSTVYLTHATAEFVREIENRCDYRDVQPWLKRAFPGPRMLGVTAPVGFDPAPRMRLNRLFWPWGASRFAFGHFTVSRDEANAVRNLAFGQDGSQMNLVTLKLDSSGIRSTNESVSTQMWMMPPQQITRTPDGMGGYVNGAKILTVVDDRHFWSSVACPNLAIDGSTTTWASLFPLFQSALGLSSLAVDTIPTAYRVPGVGLNLANELLPQVFDAAAMNIGMRVIRQLDSTVRVIGPTTAASIRRGDDAAWPMRNLTGGGSFFLDTL
jgi:hypothetical protein